MDIGEIAKKLAALEAELAAKCSRIADLEARVSFLETENARLKKAVPEGEAMDHQGEIGPTCGRLEEGLGGSKQKPVGEHVVDDVIGISDSEEEGVAVDVNKGQSAEEGVPEIPTPVKFAVRVASGQSDVEVKIIDAEGGGGDHGSVPCDANLCLCLEDDDLSITPRGKKRAAARVISDSEDEDDNDGNEEVCATSRRKRALRGMGDGESDGGQGVRAVNQKHASRVVKTGIESEYDDDELYEMERCSTPPTRRSTRLVKSQSKRIRPARRALEFVEPKDHELSEDGSEEDDSMGEFIVDDSDCTENSDDSAEESPAEPEESDNDADYKDVMCRIRGKTNVKNKDWESEQEMLPAFDEHPELVLKAVCALYRKQTEEEQAEKATILHNKQGFSQIDARRGSRIAQFLLDGDASGPLKKTAQDLKKYDRGGLDFCHKIAFRYSKQLFAISQNKEDPYFP